MVLCTLAVIMIAAYFFFGPNTCPLTKGEYLYIHTGADYAQVKESLASGGYIQHLPPLTFWPGGRAIHSMCIPENIIFGVE